MYSALRDPSGEYGWTPSSRAGMVFLTCTPWSWTSWGSRVNVSCTRLCVSMSRVDVGADLKDHRDGELAVTRGLAADVIHLLDAIDRLFKRRRDGASDRVGRSAGVGGRDLDRWRNDVRVLGDRQECRRGESEHHDEDIDDRGEAGMLNEEVREFHGSPQLRL